MHAVADAPWLSSPSVNALQLSSVNLGSRGPRSGPSQVPVRSQPGPVQARKQVVSGTGEATPKGHTGRGNTGYTTRQADWGGARPRVAHARSVGQHVTARATARATARGSGAACLFAGAARRRAGTLARRRGGFSARAHAGGAAARAVAAAAAAAVGVSDATHMTMSMMCVGLSSTSLAQNAAMSASRSSATRVTCVQQRNKRGLNGAPALFTSPRRHA